MTINARLARIGSEANTALGAAFFEPIGITHPWICIIRSEEWLEALGHGISLPRLQAQCADVHQVQ